MERIECRLHFITPFGLPPERQKPANQQVAKAVRIEARIVDVSEEYFQVLRNPRHGYGKTSTPASTAKSSSSPSPGLMKKE